MRFFIFLVLVISTLTSFQKKLDSRLFELRIYYYHPDRFDDLVTQFQAHTTRLFEKHGMENIGYWVPKNNERNAFYSVLAYSDESARESSWKNFLADPEWKKVEQQSERGGKIVEHVTSRLLNAAAISPAIQPSSFSQNRSFELRTYHCYPGRLNDLIRRFKDHTRILFEEHGMHNIAYWITVDSPNEQPDMVYMLAYKSEEDGKRAWADFRSDPRWIKVKADSESDGKIVDSVESVFLSPLRFSPIR